MEKDTKNINTMDLNFNINGLYHSKKFIYIAMGIILSLNVGFYNVNL